ncbi:uncharacterized protein F4812DRAFT_411850 [Daldinia caldariorum]|uniref:uncharacterized protein n=1 Tax=Daldinia caldariorum TaxID=326644 RepID=UPI002007A2E5|nr:uncharacterized protein F4812DRAFT_411850 [Daldinia caldariorum]KAI1473176.1 hypothetical protein F4812DRAFT_411850 [Daldinia caldariorum]
MNFITTSSIPSLPVYPSISPFFGQTLEVLLLNFVISVNNKITLPLLNKRSRSTSRRTIIFRPIGGLFYILFPPPIH